MGWGRIGFGLALAAVAGATFAYAWMAENATWWWAGALTLLGALLLVLSGIYLGGRRPRLRIPAAPLHPSRGDPPPPKLGELLVQHRIISRSQLEDALARQRSSPKYLGEVLVEMGIITPEQLSQVVEEQRLHIKHGFLWHG